MISDAYRILNAAGEDRTLCFSHVTLKNGTLTVEPREIIITTGSAEKVYDGNPLWNADFTVEGLAEGESVTIRTNGYQTEVGVSENTYLIDWDHARATNYRVTDRLGTLTVLAK